MPRKKKTSPIGADLLKLVETSLEDDKALNVVVIDLKGKSDIADYMVITHGTSQRHAGAIAQHLQEKLKASGVKGVSIEGMDQCDWVLVDGGDVIVHVFRPEVREFYNLEKMWGGPAQTQGDSVTASASASI